MHGVSLSPSLDEVHSRDSQLNGQRKFQDEEPGLYQECLVVIIKLIPTELKE